MSAELFIHGKVHILARDAALKTGLSRDYLARIAREGRVPAQRLSVGWVLDRDALHAFVLRIRTQPLPRGRPKRS
jgi:hypothetical protein